MTATAAPSDDVLSAALALADAGLPVFPLHPIRSGQCACGRDCGSPGKHPWTQHGFRDATTDPGTLHEWFARHPARGLGAATGAASGVFVVDVDPPRGFQSLADLELRHGTLPPTATVATGRGGLHLWFRHPGGVKIPSRNGVLGLGLDVKGDGGFIILPPTLHVTGRRYSWLRGLDALAYPPAWLLRLVVERPRLPRPPLPPLPPSRADRYAAAALAQEAARVARAGEGTRHSATISAAFSIGQLVGVGDIGEDEAAAVLVDAALRSGLDEREARSTVHDGLRAGIERPRLRAAR